MSQKQTLFLPVPKTYFLVHVNENISTWRLLDQGKQ